ncbi:alpha/beta fold hydrolase [Dyadobacter subterraneus]|uniref:Alpha/beta hydrolase n=1 Tax=Dyadobacter subterraneus TaxID=2773304 RepID=A0ABR9WGK1_9BACT|nr:alpha/beta hydrolase [Dyadobacter subterraneus]MBE9463279.1 alpha/beta hydrolase [Dyadobacter subterraneus]
MRRNLTILWVLLLQQTILLAQKNYLIQSADNISLNVNEYGQGTPVVLLAGGPGFNAAYLAPIWKALPTYRFIVPDQRGTGRSSLNKIDSSHMTISRYVDDLEILRKYLHIKKIVIAGHSWGGMLALAYAAKYPLHVDRLILLGPGGITSNFFKYFNSNIRMRLREEDSSESKLADSFALKMKAIWPGYFYNREIALATKVLVDTSLADHNAGIVNSLTLKDYNRTEKSRVASLRNFKSPVYLIQGRQDPVGESTVYETKSIVAQTQIFFIEKCGHLPWLESESASARFFELLKTSLN